MISLFKSLFGGGASIAQLTPNEVVALDKNDYVIVDVREKWELKIVNLADALHVPLGEMQKNLETFKNFADKKIVLMCHHGTRSQRAAGFLKSEGFDNVANLMGGIDRWSEEIDPQLRRY